MKLSTLNCRYIILDDIYIKTSENDEDESEYVHFLSRPIFDLNIPNNWNSIIYTSKEIGYLLNHKIDGIKRNFLKIVEPFKWLDLLIKGKKYNFSIMPTGSHCDNVMFMFKIENEITLYTGYFTDYQKIQNNKFFLDHKMVIDYIYLDNKYMKQMNLNEIGEYIKSIIELNPGYCFDFQLPILGYEDLIVHLVQKTKINVFVNELRQNMFINQGLKECFSDIRNAQLIFNYIPNLTLKKMKKRFKKYKIVTFQLECFDKNKNILFSKEEYLYTINWQDHPTLNKLMEFVKDIQPKKIFPIFKSIKIPPELKQIVDKTIIEPTVLKDWLNVYVDQPPTFDKVSTQSSSCSGSFSTYNVQTQKNSDLDDFLEESQQIPLKLNNILEVEDSQNQKEIDKDCDKQKKKINPNSIILPIMENESSIITSDKDNKSGSGVDILIDFFQDFEKEAEIYDCMATLGDFKESNVAKKTSTQELLNILEDGLEVETLDITTKKKLKLNNHSNKLTLDTSSSSASSLQPALSDSSEYTKDHETFNRVREWIETATAYNDSQLTNKRESIDNEIIILEESPLDNLNRLISVEQTLAPLKDNNKRSSEFKIKPYSKRFHHHSSQRHNINKFQYCSSDDSK